jgi:hypothetical protein
MTGHNKHIETRHLNRGNTMKIYVFDRNDRILFRVIATEVVANFEKGNQEHEMAIEDHVRNIVEKDEHIKDKRFICGYNPW